jgi:hypothetical protein
VFSGQIAHEDEDICKELNVLFSKWETIMFAEKNG